MVASNARACFAAKTAAGLVKKRASYDLLKHLDALTEDMARRTNKADALAQAADIFQTEALISAEKHARLAVELVKRQIDTLTRVETYQAKVDHLAKDGHAPIAWQGFRRLPAQLGGENKPSALWSSIRAMLTRDPHEVETGSNIHYLARQYRAQAHARLTGLIEALRPKNLGWKAERLLEDEVGRAIEGGKVENGHAHVLADAWKAVNDDMVAQLNRVAGADILPPRKDYLPHHIPDESKIRSVDQAFYVSTVTRLLDPSKMIDRTTKLPASPERIAEIVRLDYAAKLGQMRGDPSGGFDGATQTLANKYSAQRVLEFRDYDAWLEYDRLFGSGTGVYEAMMTHIERMAHDTAKLALIGPNENAWKRFVDGLFDREAEKRRRTVKDPKNEKEARKVQRFNERLASEIAREKQAFASLWAEVTGINRVPVDTQLASIASDVRSTLVGLRMGSAIISSISDTSTVGMTARMNDIPATGVISRAIEMMATGGSELNAAQHGLVADAIAHSYVSNDQFLGQTIRSGVAAKFASTTIRLSGLRRWSSTLRLSYGLESMAALANHQAKGFADLPPAFRAGLERYGLTAADWSVIQTTAAHEPRPGARLLRPMDMADLPVREKLNRWINTEMDHAVIESDPITRALLYGDSQPGTITGEARRAIGMFKSFPITFVNLHFARALARGWDGSRLGHGALTLIAMWGMGMVAMQAKEVLAGRDPRPLDPRTPNGLRAWGAALFQSGGLGIFGDFIGQDQSRLQTTLAATVAGPVAGLGENVLDFVGGNIKRAIDGKPTHFAGDALYLAGNFVPNLWMAKAAFQRSVMDQMALMIDDRAPARFRRIENEARKNWGQEFWWRRGETLPTRGPDFFGTDQR